MSQFSNKLLISLVSAGLLSRESVAQPQNEYTRKLQFDETNHFTIVQFSDLLINSNTDEFLATQSIMDNIIQKEKPNLVVLTGDIVQPDIVDDYADLFSKALDLLRQENIPYVWTGGNPVENKKHEKRLDASFLHEIDYEFGHSLSWTGYLWNIDQPGMKYHQEQLGYFTSRIPIFDSYGGKEVMSVYTLDTSDSSCQIEGMPGAPCANSASIDWYVDQAQKYSHGHHSRDFLFIHHPVQEFMNMANLYEVAGNKRQEINCQAMNTGLFSAAKDTKTAGWIAAGSDPDNDFYGRYHHMMLSYGRKTGAHGDGSLQRGARVFKFKYDGYDSFKGFSFVVDGQTLERKIKLEHSKPPSFGFAKQSQCGIDPISDMLGFAQ